MFWQERIRVQTLFNNKISFPSKIQIKNWLKMDVFHVKLCKHSFHSNVFFFQRCFLCLNDISLVIYSQQSLCTLSSINTRRDRWGKMITLNSSWVYAAFLCILPRCVNAKKNNKKQNLHCKIFQYPRSLKKKHLINAIFVF